MRVSEIPLLLCMLAISCQSHDLLVGRVTSSDDIEVCSAKHIVYGYPSKVVTSTFEYPKPGEEVMKVNITGVYVKDNLINGTEGYPAIVEGGIGQQYVKIKLQSQEGYGFSFGITVYGRM